MSSWKKKPVTVHFLIGYALTQGIVSIYLNCEKYEQMNSSIMHFFTSSDTEKTGITENLISPQAEKNDDDMTVYAFKNSSYY